MTGAFYLVSVHSSYTDQGYTNVYTQTESEGAQSRLFSSLATGFRLWMFCDQWVREETHLSRQVGTASPQTGSLLIITE